MAGKCLADIARTVIGCHVTHDTRVQHALDDVVSHICPALRDGFAFERWPDHDSALLATCLEQAAEEGANARKAGGSLTNKHSN